LLFLRHYYSIAGMLNYESHYTEIFDYLSAPEYPANAEPAVVFGRQDPLVAHTAGKLAAAELAQVFVITGGIGKDSGDLVKRGYDSEAAYLDEVLTDYAAEHTVSLPPVVLEKKARHGGENAGFSLNILDERGFALDSITGVIHATSSLRLAETIRFKALREHGIDTTVHRAPTPYIFDPKNPADQKEAVAELLRLADWPSQDLLLPRHDLPPNLIDFVRDVHGDARTPAPPSKAKLAIFNLLPSRLQQTVLRRQK
jgi:hypothetical protein